MQKTLKEPVIIKGIGLHIGGEVSLIINPATVNSGIVFRRIDLPNQPEIGALYCNIIDTQNCSCLGNFEGVKVSTVEHLMSVLSVLEIDNALIEIDNQEVPIMDGSALPFFSALKNQELVVQTAPRKKLKVLQKISFIDAKGNSITLEPNAEQIIDFGIEFPSKIVGNQKFCGQVDKDVFAKLIAPSRTFCEKYQVDYLHSIGLIKGGSLDNAVVVDGETILNPEGFRVDNECVNHKVLDAIGDLYLSGYHILGKLSAQKTGHFHTNELLKLLFSDPKNFVLV